jgi:predicted transcriptional regulator
MISETNVLKAFETRCRHTDPKEFEAYADVLNEAMSMFRLTGRDMSELLEVSAATVSRWIAGKNAPHAAMRRVHYTLFAERAADLLRRETRRLAQEAKRSKVERLAVPA